MRRIVNRPAPAAAFLAATFLAAAAATAEVAVLTPSRDNTLYEDPAGGVSNGAGEHLFAGRTASGSRRRALLAFDVAGSIPPGSTIDAAALTLNVSNVPPVVAAVDVELRRALADWGEGASDAPGPEGFGAPAAPGDATWLHTFHPTDFWAAPGGDFAAAASAVELVTGLGPVTWGSTAEMVADVQEWLDAPAGNFGWLIYGEGFGSQTAKRYDSREHFDPGRWPQLVVEFTPPRIQPVEIPTLSAWGFAVLAGLLLAAGVRRLQSRAWE